jgi:molybdate transport system ATP-binding protein
MAQDLLSADAPATDKSGSGAAPLLRIASVTKRFGGVLAVDNLSLDIRAGEFFALLGPSGCGKSTLLRMLAGFETPDSGSILLDGADIAAVPPHQRPINMMFQSYALFPHLSVAGNIAFGLKRAGMRRAEIAARVAEMLALTQLEGFERRRPDQLSGGQRQRVALARSLALRPRMLLLDEPLAALDARTRLQVRGELRRHLADFPGAAVMVTHDPVDATVLGDRLVVVEHGRVVQQGAPLDVARRPRTDYVARLVGLNLLAGAGRDHTVVLAGGGLVELAEAVTGPVHVAFRPAAVSLFAARPLGSPRNVWSGTVLGVEPHGDGVRVEVGGAPDAGSSILAEVTPAAVAELGLGPGREVWAAVKATEIEVYPQR